MPGLEAWPAQIVIGYWTTAGVFVPIEGVPATRVVLADIELGEIHLACPKARLGDICRVEVSVGGRDGSWKSNHPRTLPIEEKLTAETTVIGGIPAGPRQLDLQYGTQRRRFDVVVSREQAARVELGQ